MVKVGYCSKVQLKGMLEWNFIKTKIYLHDNIFYFLGNKVKGFNSDKKQGLQVSEKQKVSPWDILEGHKNPAPLSWTWFGAVKYERKPSRLEESFMELNLANVATLEKPNSYFLEANV